MMQSRSSHTRLSPIKSTSDNLSHAQSQFSPADVRLDQSLVKPLEAPKQELQPTHKEPNQERDFLAKPSKKSLHNGAEVPHTTQASQPVGTQQAQPQLNYPAVSNKQSKRHPVNLNCKVLVETTPIDHSSSKPPKALITCRHLAMAYAYYPGPKNKILRTLASPGGLHEIFNYKLKAVETQYQAVLSQTPSECQQVVCGNDLGLYLAELAQGLIKNPQTKEANCLLLTAQHAMALHLQHRTNKSVSFFELHFYDPNKTNGHRQYFFNNAATFDKLSFAKLLAAKSTLDPTNCASIYQNFDQADVSLLAISLNPKLQPALNKPLTPSPAALYLAIKANLSHTLQALIETRNTTQTTAKESYLFWSASTLDSKFCVLAEALIPGKHKSLELYLKGVLAAKELSAEQKVIILKSQSINGYPIMHRALMKAGEPNIASYFKLIANTQELSSEQKFELFHCPDKKGSPFFYRIFIKRQVQILNSFMQAVLEATDFSVDQKTTLLQAQNSKGSCGLQAAINQQDKACIKAYLTNILNSNLPQTTQSKLIGAHSLDGRSPWKQSGEVGFQTATKILKECLANTALSTKAEQIINYAWTHLNSSKVIC